MATTHELKTWPEFYQAVWSNKKTFEVRKNDRDFQVGDFLHLREYNPQTGEYTGRDVYRVVTYIFTDEGWVQPGMVVMAIKTFTKATARWPGDDIEVQY